MRKGTVMLIPARRSNGVDWHYVVQQRQSNPLWSNTDNAEVLHGYVGRRLSVEELSTDKRWQG